MEPAALLLLAVGAVLAWRAAAFLTGLVAWLMLVPVALSLLVGVPVPTFVVVFTVGMWLTSQIATRVRRGYWRSSAFRRLAGQAMLLVAAVTVLVLLAAWWRWRRDWRLPVEAYGAYMQSAAWSARKRRWRRETLLPWRRWCRVCWSPSVQLHHRTYRRLGHELHRDLVPLCRLHHERVTALHRVPGVSVEAATKRFLSRPRVWVLTALPTLPLLLAGVVALPHLR